MSLPVLFPCLFFDRPGARQKPPRRSLNPQDAIAMNASAATYFSPKPSMATLSF
jgi:hypothetical protein